jgi:hypothetical protein
MPSSSLPFMGRVDSRSERGGEVWIIRDVWGAAHFPTPDFASLVSTLPIKEREEGGRTLHPCLNPAAR